jgi:iron complex outermembrane recepter protein
MKSRANGRWRNVCPRVMPRPALIVFSTLAATSALAQESGGALEEIIVTAQKRSQSIQEVPMSISALSSAQIEQQGLRDLASVARTVPGLIVASDGPGLNQIIIRGISSVAGSAPTVSFYLDETPVSSIRNSLDATLKDLARVEVLRGPQGTLYGSSSMGGTVKYVTTPPDLSEVQLRAESSVSNTHLGGMNYNGNVVLNLPVVTDKFALRSTMFYEHADGYIDQYQPDPHNILAVAPNSRVRKDVNTMTLWGTRVQGRIEPSDTLTISPSVFYQELETGAPFQFDDPPGSFDNPIQARLLPERSKDRFWLGNLTVKKELSALEVVSSTSYFWRELRLQEDNSKTAFAFLNAPVPGFTLGETYVYPVEDTAMYWAKEFTQELRAATQLDGPVQVIGGLYYHYASNPWQAVVVPAGFSATFPNASFGFGDDFYHGNVHSETKESAVFAEMTYSPTDALKMTVGARGFRITQDYSKAVSGLFNGGTFRYPGTAEDSGITPKALISYNITQDVLAYVSAAKGFRQGGPNPPVPLNTAAHCENSLAAIGLGAAPGAFDADTLWNYEIGAKTSWLDQRFIANLSAYEIQWDKVQQRIQLACGYGFVANYGKATSRGAELELNYRATDTLTVGSTAAYTDATLDNTVPGTQGGAGDRLQNVPEWTASFSFAYDRPISDLRSIYLRGNYAYVGEKNALFDRTSPYYSIDAYSLASARLGLAATDDKWDTAIFVDNLFDQRVQESLPESLTANLPIQRRISLNRPRTVGINFKYAFR